MVACHRQKSIVPDYRYLSVVSVVVGSCRGVWSKRRQTKTATVKTATNQNGDKLYGQNGDTVSAKTATNQNDDKLYRQNGDNYRLICDVLTLFNCSFEIVYGVSVAVPIL